MNDLQHSDFPIVAEGAIGGASVQTVNARELHAFLRVGKDFSTWIRDRIEQFDFAENSDFVVLPETGEQVFQGVRGRKEYHVTIDMAKELSMVERNPQGKLARQYFIEMERRAKDPVAALNDPAVLKGLLLENLEKVLVLQTKVTEQGQQLVQQGEQLKTLDRLEGADGSLCLTDAAKTLKLRPNELTKFMHARGWIYKRVGNAAWLGYEAKIKAGYIEHRNHAYKDKDGVDRVATQALVTGKGLVKLAELLSQPMH